jgi:outer membrane lipoprotein carrier protein
VVIPVRVVGLVFALSAPSALSAVEADLTESKAVLESFDARGRTVRDFTAAFTQTFRSGALGRAIVETGTLRVKRPSRMRFDYESPEKKMFLADGISYYFYVPKDKQVMTRGQTGDRRAAARILAEDRILAHFRCVGEEADPLGRKFLLEPIEKDPDVKAVSIVLDAKLRLAAFEIKDAEGSTSRMVFENVKENVGLKESEFRFTVPKGVEVIS